MNIHPLFVHFPVALLTVYALMELLRLPVLIRQQWYVPTKAVCLFVGLIGGFASLQTGEMAEEIYRGTTTMELVRLHSSFAWYTVYVYGCISLLYAIESFHRMNVSAYLPQGLRGVWTVFRRLQHSLFHALLLVPAAVTGLILLTITGALGGAIVYGPEVDPVVSVIYHLFFLQ